MSTTSSSTSSTSSTENTLCDNIESNDSMEESSIIDANVECNICLGDDVVFIDETELESNFKSFNKTIWCLEYDCIESMEPFDTVDLLATHMRIEHSD
tara:strand:+ start:348 stop:641 length:294 start_codon:yes stop_codon:yes gene_type:complete